ncbi:HpcH/HpaI aldolase/citrate lyase family protein [Pseudonocardia broussonetiae]|uniref:HpcH/HpaI aldolase/citrate lyase family protein n=1 Tax=Pseudonocardia broussonetiae TaxID=2736640 RepID=A0A6M6JM52_9PSEU|nr:HpcH/HpaI aldolase/citrate lyase family protein [Pseudonocardia broussonetiae]QJY48395.1 HpcH/HpaI aldolase/citrate lyase family protein [Pseudonocardia broussonetiae]
MRHFGYLSASEQDELFERPPEHFTRDSGLDLLSVALGATLYMPADRPALVADITKQAAAGVTSVVVCLEDSIADEQVEHAEENLVRAFTELHADAGAELPLLFVRVREPRQMPALVARLGRAVRVLDGFVLPKFTAASGTEYLHALDDADRLGGRRLLAMPVIESGAVLYAETRVDELTRLRALLHRDRRRILAVRLGATDLCALYGLRRSPDLTIYDVKVVSNLIADVVNVLGRADGTGFTVTGPVWEYYSAAERLFKPQLRTTPFDEHDEPELRSRLVSRAIDGLIREVGMDKANGLHGKTAIHPSHVSVVNALSVVSSEEYRDASAVLGAGRASGVMASGHGNKMNEIRPHMAWARLTALQSRVFGVAREGVSFVDLLAASLPR